MIITVSGDIGSGKSTVSKLLSEHLEFNYLSTGKIQRKIAEEMNLTTLELNLLSEKDKSIDDKIDAYTIALNDSKDDYVVDSRMAWHFIPSSFKVFLSCSLEEAARRISLDQTRFGEKINEKVSILLKKIRERRESEKRRFIHLYKADYTDLSNYNLILDTTDKNQYEVASELMRQFNSWKRYSGTIG